MESWSGPLDYNKLDQGGGFDMTYQETCYWLTGQPLGAGCPYKQEASIIRSAADYFSTSENTVPCCKLIAGRYYGGLFLRADNTIAVWEFRSDERDHLLDAVPEDWFKVSLRDHWIYTVWYLDKAPWVVSNWLKENGRLI